ncbi:splicing factor: arginine/serine-rich 15-like isoform X1, partial [Dinothrombium tinctorium]
FVVDQSANMELVQAFNAELSSLYEVKPPISKAKMSQITKVAIKGIKMYKHIVQSVERFIAKCRPEYKIPGLYVIDSIVRQSRHQFNAERDVFGPRFTRNFHQTFQNLFLTCPPEDKVNIRIIFVNQFQLIFGFTFLQPKIVRVLNLWQRNNVFSADVIQPLLDMANPNANLGQIKYDNSPNVANESSSGPSKNDPDANLVLHLQQLATTLGLVKNNSASNVSGGSSGNNLGDSHQQSTVRFNKKLLDFDYGEDDEEEEKGETPTESEPPVSTTLSNSDDANANPLALSMAQNLLSNPELLQRLQQMQQTISLQQHHDASSQLNVSNLGLGSVSTSSSFISSFQPLNETKLASHQELEMSASEKQANSISNISSQHAYSQMSYNKFYSRSDEKADNFSNNIDAISDQFHLNKSCIEKRDFDYNNREMLENASRARSKSKSPSPRRSRFNRSTFRDKDERVRRSRSRSPWRMSNDRRSYRSRSRSPRMRMDRQHERSLSPETKEREKERERRRRGLPPIRKNYLTICSTTLWLGHVPKLVSEADISDTFGEFGTINSIDLIPPRGCAYVCMNRRQDAYRALQQLKNFKLHGSTIKMAWAPGKGMKGKEFKDYWDVDLGASYIPYEKVNHPDVDLDLLEDGGMIDEDTVPDTLRGISFCMVVPNVAVAPSPLAVGVPTPLISAQPNPLTTPPSQMLNSTNAGALLASPHLLQSNSLVTDAAKGDVNNQPSSSSHNLSHIVPTSLNSSIKPDISSPNATPLQMRPTIPPALHQSLGVASIFQTPLNVPPPSVISAQRPPPLAPWLGGPLLSSPQSLPFRAPNSSPLRAQNDKSNASTKYDERRPPSQGSNFGSDSLPPRLHSDRDMPGTSQRMQTHGIDRNRDRFRDSSVSGDDDPFAPSVYELKAMERSAGLRPPLIANAPRTPLLPRGFEDVSQRDRFNFDRRFNRDWRPPMAPRSATPGMIRPFEEGVRGPPPRDWGRREQWRERGNRNERFNRGHFGRNRDRDRERDRERPIRWSSPSSERNAEESENNVITETKEEENCNETNLISNENETCSNSEQPVSVSNEDQSQTST